MPPRNLLAILLTIVFSLACYSVSSHNRYANLFAEAMEVVNREALYPVEKEDLFVGAMNGMLKDLDEHSVYISGQNFKSFDEDLKQEFGGVGVYVEIDPKSKMLMVLAPLPHMPAAEAGMQVGDLVISIAGQPTYGKTRSEAVKSLRGPIGESIELEVQRGEEQLTMSLERARIPIESVHGDYRQADGTWQYRLKDHPEIGYIRLSQFGEKSGIEVREALKEISAGQNVEGLILDIRANSGGLLDVAVEICDMFLKEGKPIVKICGRDRVERDTKYSENPPVFDVGVPVCVLVDRYSASASEIVAACLQDHGRAILIGEQSYGKGTVQDIIPIQRGESVLKLTTSSYWRPSGAHIDRNDEVAKASKVWGVQPDEGYKIEMTVEDLLRNLKARNARDVEGLMSGKEELLSETRGSGQNGSNANGPEPDESVAADAGEDSPEVSDAEENHIDMPMQKAIEYLKTQQAIAAKAA